MSHEPAWVEIGNRLISFVLGCLLVLVVLFFLVAFVVEVLYGFGVGNG